MHLSYPDSETRETGILVPNSPALSILILFLLLFAAACGDLSEYDSEQIRTAMHDSLITTTESWDVDMTLLEAGQRRITLQGSYALNFNEPDRKETRIRGPVYVQIFDSTGTLESEAWSRRAIYYANEREFELFDSVRVETVRNRKLFSDYLKWSERTDRITSDRHVTIVTPADSLTGSGFTSKTDLTDYVITEIRGRFIVD